jgi:hypothetical protein
MIWKEGFYLGWRWSQASGVVAGHLVVRRRGASRPAVVRKTIGVTFFSGEVEQRRGTLAQL